jgi:scyllo-inositol 2-dehydrogenase (NADP+)
MTERVASTFQKINTAILSYGMSGSVFHLPLLEAHPGYTVKAILHRNINKKIDHRYPVVHTMDEILKDRSIDLVIVNTPNNTHFEFAAQALDAGKHVVVEKPFTVTTKEADELIEIAHKNLRTLTVFQNRRWDGDFLTVKKVIEDHQVGQLVEFECHYDRFRNTISDSWKEVPKPGVSILYNLGSHLIDQVLVLFGLPLYLDARLAARRPGSKVEDYYDIRFEYKDFHVILKSSYLVKEPGPRYIVHGTEGSFIKKGLDVQEQDLTAGKKPGTPGWGGEGEDNWGTLNTLSYNGSIETIPGNYVLFYENLYDTIFNGLPLAVKPEEARNVVWLIEACIESNRLKKAIRIFEP